MTRGLTMVTEIGSTLDVITLVQLPWQERFRVGIFVFVFKVAQNCFQQLDFDKFITTAFYHLMLQSWYHKTVQSLVNTLLSFS